MEITTMISFLQQFGVVEGSLVLLLWHCLNERRKFFLKRIQEEEQQKNQLRRELTQTREDLARLQQQLNQNPNQKSIRIDP